MSSLSFTVIFAKPIIYQLSSLTSLDWPCIVLKVRDLHEAFRAGQADVCHDGMLCDRLFILRDRLQISELLS